jgi:cytochrome c oxidase subunit 3
MSSHTSQHPQHYFVPQPSVYPFILSGGIFLLALGFILQMNAFAPGSWIMLAATAVILFVAYNWFRKIIGENQSGVLYRLGGQVVSLTG